jgi:hypothetical protein
MRDGLQSRKRIHRQAKARVRIQGRPTKIDSKARIDDPTRTLLHAKFEKKKPVLE